MARRDSQQKFLLAAGLVAALFMGPAPGVAGTPSVLNAECAKAHVVDVVGQAELSGICVFGAVAKPGLVDWNAELTPIDAVGAAGGVLSNADPSRISVDVLDPSNEERPGDRDAVQGHGFRLASTDALAPGTLLFVPERNDSPQSTAIMPVSAQEPQAAIIRARPEQPVGPGVVRILGAVNQPGRYTLDHDTDVLSLLADAGGLRADARERNVIIMRAGTKGEALEVVDLREFARFDALDAVPNLAPGDAIYVPVQGPTLGGQLTKGLGLTASALSIILIGVGL